MEKKLNEIVNQLINDLKNKPENFSFDKYEYCVIDGGTGIEYWVSGDYLWLHIYKPEEVYFGLIQTIRLRYAFGKWKRKMKASERIENVKKLYSSFRESQEEEEAK